MGARRGRRASAAAPATRRAGARQAQAAPASTINMQLSRISTYKRFLLQVKRFVARGASAPIELDTAKEKAQTRARDALAAERRRMPWMAVATAYAFEGPAGKANLLDLFQGRRQLIAQPFLACDRQPLVRCRLFAARPLMRHRVSCSYSLASYSAC
jgi:hypothetical protein